MTDEKISRAYRLLFLLKEINPDWLNVEPVIVYDHNGEEWSARYDDRGDIYLQGPVDAFRMSLSVFLVLRDTALMKQWIQVPVAQ